MGKHSGEATTLSSFLPPSSMEGNSFWKEFLHLGVLAICTCPKTPFLKFKPHSAVGGAFDSKSQLSRAQYPVQPQTFVEIDSSPSADSRRAVVSYWLKYVDLVLINCLGLSLPRNSVVGLTDHPNMTLAVYHGYKAATQQPLLNAHLVSEGFTDLKIICKRKCFFFF